MVTVCKDFFNTEGGKVYWEIYTMCGILGEPVFLKVFEKEPSSLGDIQKNAPILLLGD